MRDTVLAAMLVTLAVLGAGTIVGGIWLSNPEDAETVCAKALTPNNFCMEIAKRPILVPTKKE